MKIAHNILAMNASRQNSINRKGKAQNIERLSSGYRINRAADDAAGLAISEKMRTQIRDLAQGVKNIEEGISLCQVADGAMSEVHDMIHRMRELCVQSVNGTNTDSERAAIDKEIQQIKEEIDDIGHNTIFNNIQILQGGKEVVGFEEKEIIQKIYVNEPYEKEIVVSRGEISDFSKSENNPWIQYYFGMECNKQYSFESKRLNLMDVGESTITSYTLDFSKIQSQEDWLNLDSAAMYYTCTAGCGQRFIFLFDSNSEDVKNLSPTHDMMAGGTQNWMLFSVGTKNFLKGSDFVKAMREFIGTLDTTGYPDTTNNKGENIQVGHINKMGTTTGNDLVVYDSFANGMGKFKVYSPIFTNTIKETRTYYRKIEKEVKDKILIPIETDKELIIQYGANSGQNFEMRLPHIDCEALDMCDVAGQPLEEAIKSINILSDVLQKVSKERSRMGAYTNGLEHLASAENTTLENIAAAESRIRDFDMAEGVMIDNMYNILQQASEAILAQANHMTAGVLNLLK